MRVWAEAAKRGTNAKPQIQNPALKGRLVRLLRDRQAEVAASLHNSKMKRKRSLSMRGESQIRALLRAAISTKHSQAMPKLSTFQIKNLRKFRSPS